MKLELSTNLSGDVKNASGIESHELGHQGDLAHFTYFDNNLRVAPVPGADGFYQNNIMGPESPTNNVLSNGQIEKFLTGPNVRMMSCENNSVCGSN